MGGIVIDIWEKSNFFGSFGSQKGAKNALKAPSYGRVNQLKDIFVLLFYSKACGINSVNPTFFLTGRKYSEIFCISHSNKQLSGILG